MTGGGREAAGEGSIEAARGSRVVERAATLRGSVRLPSDKSLAHRALIANAMAAEPSVVTVRLPGADVRSTVDGLRRLGATIEEEAGEGTVRLTVRGWGRRGAEARQAGRPVEMDCGNSGTSIRLLSGVAAGRPGETILDGDASLRERPMERVARPLRAMGAEVATRDGCPPIRVVGRRALAAVEHRPDMPSAQVLGAIAFAALAAEGETQVILPGPSRDHTERLLGWMGVPIERTPHEAHGNGTRTRISGPAMPRGRSLAVPGDPSAAAAWLVAAALMPGSDVRLPDICLNPTRLGLVEALRDMGAEIEISEWPGDGPEPVGELRIRGGERLDPIAVEADRAAWLIDELPVLAIAMAAARGRSELRGAGELRVKESDRIALVVRNLAGIGARVEELPDGWRVGRGAPRDATIRTDGDHRIAMAFAVAAAMGVAGTVAIDDPGCVTVSYPTFWRDLTVLTALEAAA